MKNKRSRKMRTSMLVVSGSVLALFSATAPAMAAAVKPELAAYANVNTADAAKTESVEEKNLKQEASSSVPAESLVTNVSDKDESGKRVITFTVPDGNQGLNLEFFSYKKTETGRTLHSKAEGTYNAGTYTAGIAMPEGSEQYDLEISCRRSDGSRIVLWSRSESEKEWKAAISGAVSKPEQSVKGNNVLTELSNTTGAGKANISFNVLEDKAPVNLDFIVYKKTDNGRAVYSKFNGNFTAGKHTVGVDLPKDSTEYDLEVCSNTGENVSVILWGRSAGGEWKEVNGNTAGLAAVVKDKLNITLVPADQAANLWSWTAENPNEEPVSLKWKIDGTDLDGAATIEPGDKVVLATNKGETQHMVVSVPGNQGYELIVSSDNNTGKPVATVPGSAGTDGTGSGSGSPSGGSPSSGNSGPGSPSGGVSTPGGDGAGSNGGSSPSVTPPAAVPNPAQPAGGGQGIPVAAAEENGITPPGVLDQPSGAQITQLPQTGEQAPYGIYTLGALLTLFGSFFLRKKSRS